MNLVRVGRGIRVLRRRKGWRQVDLARRAVCSQQAVSLAERGRSEVSLRTLQRMAAALEADVDVTLRWRGAGLDRLLDESHARLVGATLARLERGGWLVRVEVTYRTANREGSIDLLAFEPQACALLVVEVKSEIVSVEGTIRKLDEKVRVARAIAMDRFGWQAAAVSRTLVLPRTTTAWRALDRHRSVFAAAFPVRGARLSSWLRAPAGGVSGILTIPFTRPVGGRSGSSGSGRIRAPTVRACGAQLSTALAPRAVRARRGQSQDQQA